MRRTDRESRLRLSLRDLRAPHEQVPARDTMTDACQSVLTLPTYSPFSSNSLYFGELATFLLLAIVPRANTCPSFQQEFAKRPRFCYKPACAGVAELVDAPDLGSGAGFIW